MDCDGIYYSVIFPDIGGNDSHPASEIRNAMINAYSLGYIAAAIALTFLRHSWIVERFPTWLNISVLGSALSHFIAFVTADAMYFSSLEGRGVLWQWHWSGVFMASILGTILFSLYIMPFTLMIYYSSSLWRRLKCSLSLILKTIVSKTPLFETIKSDIISSQKRPFLRRFFRINEARSL